MKSLEQIAREIENCSECKKGKSGLAVPGEGNPKAGIMLIGEAPGKKESETGRPFVGRAGKFLDKVLAGSGIERKSVFITSPVKYFPGNRAPDEGEINHGRTHLMEQIEAVSPELVVLMGRVAMATIFPDGDISVTRDHGKIIRKDGRDYVVTVHPSAAMRFNRMRAIITEDFGKLKKLAGRIE